MDSMFVDVNSSSVLGGESQNNANNQQEDQEDSELHS